MSEILIRIPKSEAHVDPFKVSCIFPRGHQTIVVVDGHEIATNATVDDVVDFINTSVAELDAVNAMVEVGGDPV